MRIRVTGLFLGVRSVDILCRVAVFIRVSAGGPEQGPSVPTTAASSALASNRPSRSLTAENHRLNPRSLCCPSGKAKEHMENMPAPRLWRPPRWEASRSTFER